MQAIFIVPIIVLVFLVPESPRWLAAHGKSEQSLSVIARLQGKPITHQDVIAQHQEIQSAVELEQSIGSGSWGDLLKKDKLHSRRRLLIACSIQFFQQVGGINAIIFYAGNFFALVSDQGALLAGGLFTWFFVASFIPWFLIDTAGRRKLLLFTIAGMAAAFAIESALVWKTQSSGSKAAGGAAIAVLFVYMGLFTVCPTPFTFRQTYRALADLLDRIPSRCLGLPIRNPTSQTPTKGISHLDRLQLDHQLCYRPSRTHRSQEHWLQILHHLRHHQRLILACDLSVLSRDKGPIARGNRSSIHRRRGKGGTRKSRSAEIGGEGWIDGSRAARAEEYVNGR